ncbi:unnamed protein product [Calicophoron daubneyi]|uniref:Ephrin RBD domain-containing protein n=1 Tax=Calicophoron daubneyi TaxID=300641 RepID=A0AAV2TKZ2_CALDB
MGFSGSASNRKTEQTGMPSLIRNELFTLIAYARTAIVFCLLIGKLLAFIPPVSNASRTHAVYWDPDNVIFQSTPAPLLHVHPRDEVIFICPYDSLYILWTYERHAFDSCSLWANNKAVVGLLFKCPSTTNTTQSSVQSGFMGSAQEPIIRRKRASHDAHLQRARPRNASTKKSPDKNYRPPGDCSDGRRCQRRPRRSSVNAQLFSDLFDYPRTQWKASGERFTLLVDEFSWANGNPRFVKNRPVFFMAQSSLCRIKNMRMGIINGLYEWNSPAPSTNHASALSPHNCTSRPRFNQRESNGADSRKCLPIQLEPGQMGQFSLQQCTQNSAAESSGPLYTLNSIYTVTASLIILRIPQM